VVCSAGAFGDPDGSNNLVASGWLVNFEESFGWDHSQPADGGIFTFFSGLVEIVGYGWRRAHIIDFFFVAEDGLEPEKLIAMKERGLRSSWVAPMLGGCS